MNSCVGMRVTRGSFCGTDRVALPAVCAMQLVAGKSSRKRKNCMAARLCYNVGFLAETRRRGCDFT